MTTDQTVTQLGNGKIMISLSCAEKVGLPNYSNVDIGPAVLTRIVDDGDDAHVQAEFAKIGGVLEHVIAQQREITLEALKAFAAAGGYRDVRNQ